MLFGRVLLAGGRPAAGAAVAAYPVTDATTEQYLVAFPRNPLAGSTPAERVTAGADGSFSFSRLTPGPWQIAASHPKGSPRLLPAVFVHPGKSTGPLAIELGPLFKLAGKVTDPAGHAVAGAQVTLLATNDQPVPPVVRITDAEGGFTLEPAAGLHALFVRASGYVPQLFPEIPAPGAEAKLVVQKGGGVAGVVLDRDTGEPVAGAQIEGVLGDWNDRTASDGKGRFALANALPGEGLLTASHPQYAARQVSVRIARGRTAELRIVLRRGLSVTGLVVEKGGGPLADVEVLALPHESPAPTVRRARTGADGRFALDGVAPGATLFWLLAPRHALPAPAEAFVQAGRTNEVTLEAVAAASVEGQVVTPDGDPVAGATLRIAPKEPGHPASAWLERTTHSDGQGRFELAVPLLHRDFQLEVRHTERATTFFGPLRLGPGETHKARIEMQAGAIVRGKVSGPGDILIGGAIVSLLAPSQASGTHELVTRTASDETGSYRLAGIHPGASYQLRVEAPGFRTVYSPEFALAQGQAAGALDFRLEAGAELSGRVQTPDGEPVLGATLEVKETASGLYLARTSSRRDGRFAFDNLSPGPYTVSAFQLGFAAFTREEIRPGAGLVVELLRERTITLEVELPDGFDHAYHVRVHALKGGGEVASQATLEEQGARGQSRITLGPLPEGRYQLAIHGPGLVPETLGPVEAAGEGGAVQYARLRYGEMITGLVVEEEEGKPVNGAAILRGSLPATITLVEAHARGLVVEGTHPDGSFHVTGFEAGKVTVTVLHPEYQTATAELKVGKGAPNRIVLARGHSLDVEVEATAGAPRQGREVRLEGPAVREGHTNAEGKATLAGLLPGAYRLRVDGDRVGPEIRVPDAGAVKVAAPKKGKGGG